MTGMSDELQALLAEQTSIVRVEPGNVLLIGGVKDFDYESVDQALLQLKELTGAARVFLFADDIDVQAMGRAEAEHVSFLERQRDEVLAYLDEATAPCNFTETGVCTHEDRIDTGRIRDLLKEKP